MNAAGRFSSLKCKVIKVKMCLEEIEAATGMEFVRKHWLLIKGVREKKRGVEMKGFSWWSLKLSALSQRNRRIQNSWSKKIRMHESEIERQRERESQSQQERKWFERKNESENVDQRDYYTAAF